MSKSSQIRDHLVTKRHINTDNKKTEKTQKNTEKTQKILIFQWINDKK